MPISCWSSLTCLHGTTKMSCTCTIKGRNGAQAGLTGWTIIKREEIRNQASLTTYNRQISFLNILSDLDCSFQEGNKKYLFCNPTLL